MSLDQNLMGLGLPAALAARVANGGTGPVTIKAAGSGATTATQITGKQFLVFVNTGSGWLSLPSVGGSDMAAEIADDFLIHNGLTSPVTVAIPSGVTVNIGSVACTTSFTLASLTTANLWVVSSTQWFGLKST